MKTHTLAIGLIFAAALWRMAVPLQPALFNVAPITALAFCGAVYFRDWRGWLIPFGALVLSDVWLNHYHATNFGYTWSVGEMALRSASIAVAVGFGALVARRCTLVTLTAGALGSSLAFYVATNTVSWLMDLFYARSLAGWVQALTVGHPEFPSTLWFFRNTLAGDLTFTIVFVLAVQRSLATEQRPPLVRV